MEKLKKTLNKTWKLLTSKKAETRIHTHIKRILDRNNIKYSITSPSNDIQFRFETEDHLLYAINISTESKTDVVFFVSFNLNLNPNAYDRICHLSQLFNDHLRNCILRLNMEHQNMSLQCSLPLEHCHLNPDAVLSAISEIDRYATDIIWSFNKLLHSNDEAVFIFAEMVERINNKHLQEK